MLLDAAQSQVVLVDLQAKLMPAIAGADAVLANAERLGRLARLVDVPVFGTEQSASKLGPNLPEIAALCRRMLGKEHFSAVADGLVDWLRAPVPAPRAQGSARSLPKHLRRPVEDAAPGRNQIVIAGCEAHVCVLQTALDLLDEDFEVWLVVDACGARTEASRDAAFDRLAAAGAELVTTEMVGFEWLRSARHPAFRDLQALIR